MVIFNSYVKLPEGIWLLMTLELFPGFAKQGLHHMSRCRAWGPCDPRGRRHLWRSTPWANGGCRWLQGIHMKPEVIPHFWHSGRISVTFFTKLGRMISVDLKEWWAWDRMVSLNWKILKGWAACRGTSSKTGASWLMLYPILHPYSKSLMSDGAAMARQTSQKQLGVQRCWYEQMTDMYNS